MPPLARLFRAGSPEQPLDRLDDLPRRVGNRELLWIDLPSDGAGLGRIATRLGLELDVIRDASRQPEVVQVDDVVVLTAFGLHLGRAGPQPRPAAVRVVAVQNTVVTISEGEVAGLHQVVGRIQGSSELGTLNATTFVALLMDGLIAAFFEATEAIEREVDALDDRVLRGAPRSRDLQELGRLRRDIAVLRRTLNPHRGVIAALARPELGLTLKGQDDPWPDVLRNLDRAIDAVENARELLIGSFDLVMTRTAQRTNDVVRVLTVVSVTLLPAGVIAGIFGMNFRSPLFESQLFLPAIGFIALVSLVILGVARWRKWI